jgi:hypothetical protein
VVLDVAPVWVVREGVVHQGLANGPRCEFLDIVPSQGDAGFIAVRGVWPKPGSTEPVEKGTYVTKVGDQICGVGYYKQ